MCWFLQNKTYSDLKRQHVVEIGITQKCCLALQQYCIVIIVGFYYTNKVELN